MLVSNVFIAHCMFSVNSFLINLFRLLVFFIKLVFSFIIKETLAKSGSIFTITEKNSITASITQEINKLHQHFLVPKKIVLGQRC